MNPFLPDEEGRGMVFPDALPCATCGGTLRAGICPRCLITGALAEDEDAGEETPAWLGDYELLNEIARGGMGVVWRARQRRLNRVVALKLLRESSLPGESGARRFRIEAEAAAALRHPHIVHVYEVGETGGRWFLSMELLAGSLAEKLRAGHLSPREAAGLLAKIARAVQHAHDRGILHRDLKPANILLDEAGEPRVSDFGLARLEARPDDLTVSGAALGTPAYMSPEQAAGKHREITTLSDVHGLGTILYEALTGRLPFRGESQLAVLRRVTEEEPARPSAGTPGIDRDLDTICLRCLQKEPARRYPSALALAEDLDRWARGEPIMARRAGTVERLWKWARRRPAAAALWIVAVLVLAGGIAGAALYTVRLERERAAALHRVSRQHVQTALGLMESGEWHRALLLLAEAVEMGTGDAGRDRVNRLRFECLARQSPRLAALWFHEGDAPRQAVFSAGNGALVLFQGRRARLHDAATGLPLGPPLESAREIVAGDVSADGTRVILGDNENHYTLWDPIAGRIIARGEGRLCPFPPSGVSCPAGIFGGGRFVVSRGNEALCFDARTGEPSGEGARRHAPLTWAMLTPDGTTVLSLTEDHFFRPGLEQREAEGTLHALTRLFQPAASGTLECPPEARLMYFHREMRLDALQARGNWFGIVHWPEFVPKQTDRFREPLFAQSFRKGLNWILLARSPRGVSVVDGWAPVTPRLLDHGASGIAGAFDAEGGVALTLASDGGAQYWDLVGDRPLGPRLRIIGAPLGLALSGDGKSALLRGTAPAVWLWRQRTPVPATDIPPATTKGNHSVDGKLEAYLAGDATVALRDAVSGTILFPPLRHPAPVEEAVFSPDGILLATRAGDSVRVWETATGQPVTPPMVHLGVTEARWSPEGTRLYTRGADGWRMADMSPASRPLPEMKTLARLLAAGRFVPGSEGDILPLTAGELRSAWEATGSAQPE